MEKTLSVPTERRFKELVEFVRLYGHNSMGATSVPRSSRWKGLEAWLLACRDREGPRSTNPIRAGLVSLGFLPARGDEYLFADKLPRALRGEDDGMTLHDGKPRLMPASSAVLGAKNSPPDDPGSLKNGLNYG